MVNNMSTSSTIRISVETKKKLNEIGKLNDTYNSVIEKLIDSYEKNETNKKNK